MLIFIQKCLTTPTPHKVIKLQKSHNSGIIKTDVLKWITAVKCGWQFDCSCSVAWVKYQDRVNVMIKMEHMNLV